MQTANSKNLTLFWNDLIHIKLFQPAVDKVSRSPDAPVDVAAVRTLYVVVGVFALGHDPITAADIIFLKLDSSIFGHLSNPVLWSAVRVTPSETLGI